MSFCLPVAFSGLGRYVYRIDFISKNLFNFIVVCFGKNISAITPHRHSVLLVRQFLIFGENPIKIGDYANIQAVLEVREDMFFQKLLYQE